MSGFIEAVSSQPFMQTALFAGLLASVSCGIVGTYVVAKRIGLLAGGLAHAVLGGMGAAYFFGHSPIAGALIAAVLIALLIGWISLKHHENEDTIIAALWAVGMAIGILFISKTPGYNVDLMSYLFGNILLIRPGELLVIAVLDLIIVAATALFGRQFLAITFDEEFAELRGVHVQFYYLFLLTLVALTVVILIQVVGLILVIALLTLPAAIAGQHRHSLVSIMVLAVMLGAFFTTAGLALSYGPDLPPGATIVLLAGATYLLSTLLKGWRSKRR